MKDERRIWRAGSMVAAACTVLSACGNRSDDWNTVLDDTAGTVALAGTVAVRDPDLGRLLFLRSADAGDVAVDAQDLGQGVTDFLASPDAKSLYVLSAGKQPRTEPDDEKPRLQIFSGETKAEKPRTFELDDPMGKLALDPEGEWVAAFAGDGTVTNPNEIVLLDLKTEGAKPVSKSIRSFGGRPLQLSFTPLLNVPEGPARRFVVVRTDRDITLIDLSNPTGTEVTVKVPKDSSGSYRVPKQVVADDGAPEVKDDARLAILLENTSDVMLLQLGASPTGDYAIVPNVVDAGGVPSAIDFVRTDGGLRLAALVPSLQQATLIDPETTLTQAVALGSSYSNMTRITTAIDQLPSGGDVALLWGSGNRFAFWSLGSTSGTPYRAIDSTELDIALSEVLDVPAPNEHLKVLVSQSATSFYVLDLQKRESFPFETKGAGFRVEPSPDGQRLWAYAPGNPNFSHVRLSDMHPSELYVQPAPKSVFDIARSDGSRAALVLGSGSELSVTLLDAQSPDSAHTRYFPALDLKGIR